METVSHEGQAEKGDRQFEDRGSGRTWFQSALLAHIQVYQ